MRISVRRTGGFAGIEKAEEVDTEGLADAGDWQALAATVLAEPPVDEEAARGVPDGFSYEITVDGWTVRCRAPPLPQPQRALITRVLKEGA